MIHRHELSKLFGNSNNLEENLQEEDKNWLINNINDNIDNFCQKMNMFMRKKYLNVYMDDAKKELAEVKVNNPHEIFSKMQKGDYRILDEVISFSNGKSKYPFQHYYRQKMEEICADAKEEM